MTASSPAAETARFIAKVLSARPTPVAELPEMIAILREAFQRLDSAEAPVVQPVRLPPPIARPAPVAARPQRPAAEPAPVSEVPRRGRGRPRRVVAPAPVPEEATAPPEPPQPKLLRRADILAHEQEHPPQAAPVLARDPNATMRGVVKWFDGRAGKGALRLTGLSGDVMLDAAVLARCGIKRLYKDQEIEATIEESGGRTQLLSLSLPGRNAVSAARQAGGEIIGTVRRQPRSVMVEVKRDGMRQRAARAEAEQLLGSVGGLKLTRRLTS